jgi:hypothetical protein
MDLGTNLSNAFDVFGMAAYEGRLVGGVVRHVV